MAETVWILYQKVFGSHQAKERQLRFFGFRWDSALAFTDFRWLKERIFPGLI